MLSDYGVYWFEENAPLPIAGGEVLTRRQSFVRWIRECALDIVQPDVTKVGGISEERKIAWMAEENGIRSFRTDGTLPLDWRRTFTSHPQTETRTWSSTLPVLLLSTTL